MSLLVTGSIGIDSIESPAGKVENVLGGSAVYFACAASYFTDVRFVAVAGEDMPEGFLSPLDARGNIDMSGLEIRSGSRTFRWAGRYHEDVNMRDTLDTQLGVLGEAGPKIPENFRDSQYVFLANSHPGLQADLLGQLASPKLVVADTMNLWIDIEVDLLKTLLGKIDALILNDSEAQQLTGLSDTVAAGLEVAKMVKKFVVVKKGEHGCLLFGDGQIRALPAWPSQNVVDPTGAGDSFAGAMMGYLTAADKSDIQTVQNSLAWATVVASLELEGFSLEKLATLTKQQIDERYEQFKQLCSFG